MAFDNARQRWPSTSDPAQHFTIHKISFFDDDADANRDTPIHECALLVDERIVPFLPQSIVQPGHVKCSDPPFQIAPSPTSYGLGLIATRPISAGSPLYIEHPTIIAPQRIPLSFKDKRSAFKMLSDCLPDFGGDDENGRKGLLNMANAYPVLGFHELAGVAECESGEEGGEEGDEPPIPQEEGILLTNAISLSLFPSASASPSSSPPPCLQDQKHGGVFLTLNRSNHSCGPNTAHKWDPSTLSMTLYALRTIRSGEEITMTYTDITIPRRTRQETLLTRYKFPCGCAFCRFPRSEDETRAREYEDMIGHANELSEEDRKMGVNQESQERESDWVRTTLGSYRHTHPCYLKWSTDLARPDDHVISSHLRALSMIDREGLHGLARFHLEEIVLCYGALGDEENFRKWARRLLELSQVMDENLSQELRGWLQDPHRMKRWAWRKKQRDYMSKLRQGDADPVEDFFVPSLF